MRLGRTMAEQTTAEQTTQGRKITVMTYTAMTYTVTIGATTTHRGLGRNGETFLDFVGVFFLLVVVVIVLVTLAVGIFHLFDVTSQSFQFIAGSFQLQHVFDPL